MEGKAWNARSMPSSHAAARTAKQPGLILAAAWVGGKLGGCHGGSMGVNDGRCGVWRLVWGVRWWKRALAVPAGDGAMVCSATG
jgi:hypothetical protein